MPLRARKNPELSKNEPQISTEAIEELYRQDYREQIQIAVETSMNG